MKSAAAQRREVSTPAPLPRAWTLTIFALAALPRAWAAIFDHGIFWPDEIYQSLEMAHALVFGRGLLPWESTYGLRSWVFPGAIAGLWKLASLAGVSSGPALVILAKLAMASLGVAGVWVTWRIARALGGEEAGLLAGLMAAAFPASIVYGSRAMSEAASAPVLGLAVWCSMDQRRSRWVLAGALAGLAVFLRYQNGVVAALLGAALLAARRWRAFAHFAGAAAAVSLLGGLLDWATWGRPFHSLIEYLRFNLVEGGAAQWGTASWRYYPRVFWTGTGPAAAAIVVGLVLGARRTPGLLAMAGGFVALHAMVPHKEYRFLLPVVPLLLAAAGVGLAEGLRRLRLDRRAAAGLGAAMALSMLWKTARMTFDDMGQQIGASAGQRSPWHSGEEINRLLWEAGARADLCGLAWLGVDAGGAYSYLHRDVPVYWAQRDVRSPALYNYAIVSRALRPAFAGWQEVAARGDALLLRRDGGCAPSPAGYQSVLNVRDPATGRVRPP